MSCTQILLYNAQNILISSIKIDVFVSQFPFHVPLVLPSHKHSPISITPPASYAAGITDEMTPYVVPLSDLTSDLDPSCILPRHISRTIFYLLSIQNCENITPLHIWQDCLYRESTDLTVCPTQGMMYTLISCNNMAESKSKKKQKTRNCTRTLSEVFYYTHKCMHTICGREWYPVETLLLANKNSYIFFHKINTHVRYLQLFFVYYISLSFLHWIKNTFPSRQRNLIST